MMQMIMQTNNPKIPTLVSISFPTNVFSIQTYEQKSQESNMYIFVRFNFPMSTEVTQIKYSEGGSPVYKKRVMVVVEGGGGSKAKNK